MMPASARRFIVPNQRSRNADSASSIVANCERQDATTRAAHGTRVASRGWVPSSSLGRLVRSHCARASALGQREQHGSQRNEQQLTQAGEQRQGKTERAAVTERL